MALAAIAFYAHLNEVLSFVCSGVAIALLAALVGRCVERLGDRLGAGATGVLQSALGNLPELFISFFALRAGLLTVVQSALIGSILANLLLVLGAAFLVGGLKHGTQRFDHGRARTTAVLLALATAALVLPSLAAQLHSPAGGHETALSVAVAIILLAIFALSLPASLRRQAEPAMGRSLAVDQQRSPTGTDAASRCPAIECGRTAAGRSDQRTTPRVTGRSGSPPSCSPWPGLPPGWSPTGSSTRCSPRSTPCTSHRRSPAW